MIDLTAASSAVSMFGLQNWSAKIIAPAGQCGAGAGAGAGPPPRRSPPRPGLGRQDGGEEGREDDPRAEAAELAGRLDRASEDLVDNLFRFLSACRRGRGGGGG